MPAHDGRAEAHHYGGTVTDEFAVSCRHIAKVYGRPPVTVVALDDVSLDFRSNRFTAIMGPSGSGKSTLLHLLAGLDDTTRGTVSLAGTPLDSLSDDELTLLRRDRVGFVFQTYNLLPMYTARQNITLPCELSGTPTDHEWLETLCAALSLNEWLEHLPHELAGGQQQRVAIARALITRPAVIFADEPTGNLDTRATLEVLALLRRAVRELGQTVVLVTHDPIAASYADEVILLADGKVAGTIKEPTPDSVMTGLEALSNLNGVGD